MRDGTSGLTMFDDSTSVENDYRGLSLEKENFLPNEREIDPEAPLLAEEENPGRKSNKPWTTRRYVTIFGYLILTTFLVILVFLAIFNVSFSSEPVGVCSSAECADAARELLSNMAFDYSSIDPCEDFHAFACGGWDVQHPLREDIADLQTWTIMKDHVYESLRGSLEDETTTMSEILEVDDAENIATMKKVYGACMDEDALRASDVTPLMDVLEQIDSYFAVSVEDEDDRGQLAEVSAYVNSIGVPGFLAFSVEADEMNPDVWALYLRSLGAMSSMFSDYYENEAILAKYRESISATLRSLKTPSVDGNSDRTTSYKNLAVELSDFEARLLALPTDSNNTMGAYERISPFDIDDLVPQLGISRQLGILGAEPVSEALISSRNYLSNLSTLLYQTNPEIIREFFLWRAVQTFSQHIRSDAVLPVLQFERWLQDQDPDRHRDRWRDCTRFLDDNLSWLTSRQYVLNTGVADATSYASSVTEDIKAAMVSRLASSSWMEPSAQHLSILKAENLVSKLAYPQISSTSHLSTAVDLTSASSIHAFYAPISPYFSVTSHFSNVLLFATHSVNSSFAHLSSKTNPQHKVDRSTWALSPTIPSAQYRRSANEILLPAAMLQRPVFWSPGPSSTPSPQNQQQQHQLPSYLTYGAFGSIVGHELTHAFDASGRHYDEHGRRHQNGSWWGNATAAAFEEKAACFVRQYADSFGIWGPREKTAEGGEGEATWYPVNGDLTLDENIADAGGLAVAYQAWDERRRQRRKKTKKRGEWALGGTEGKGGGEGEAEEDLALPGMEAFPPEQMFFLAYAGMWCSSTRPAMARWRIFRDPHAPNEARLMGAAQNSREFREAFRCARREPVCELW